MNNIDSLPLIEVDEDEDLESTAGPSAWVAPDYRVFAWSWVAVCTVARLLCIARLPLGNGEAYYATWSRFLDWSYYDHPPLVAWMVRATTIGGAFGSSELAVHVGPIIASGLFGLLFHRLAEKLVSPRAAFIGLIIVSALPVFLASSFIVNPEAPLAPLWVGALLAILAMRENDEGYRPIVAGALIGLAFLAKYTAILLVPAALVYFAASPSMRRWLRRPSFYAGGLAALAVTMPVVAWNVARGWPSLRLHLVERAGVGVPVAGENTVNQLVAVSSSTGGGLWQQFGRVFVGQFLSYSPLLAPLLVWGLVRAARRARFDDRDLFITAFTWPVLLPLLAAMLHLKDAEQHWTMVAFIPAAIAAGQIVDDSWTLAGILGGARATMARWTRGLAWSGVALSGVLFVAANVHVHTTLFLDMMPPGYDPRADIGNELAGWSQVATAMTRAAGAARGPVVMAANHYSLCGRLAFETGDATPVYCPTARRSAFTFFDRQDPPADATVIALTSDIQSEMPAGLRARACSVVDRVEIERSSRVVARYYVHACAPLAARGTDGDLAQR